ncbi:MAG: hypothetical protein OEV06_09310 [Anaerolineae bacterium]|nr:hypothetical protein [Anaerolineae bacterium]
MTLRKLIYGALSISAFLTAVACTAEPQGPDADDPVLGDPDKSAPPSSPGAPSDPEGWVRGNAFINETDLLIMESYPIQVSLLVLGELPTPCNRLAYDIDPPDEENQIHIEIYSLYEPETICIQVIEPFEENISISSLDTPLDEGLYTVWVNGEKVGEFNYPGG